MMDDDNSRGENPNDADSHQLGNGNGSDSAESLVLRPVFLGNLNSTFTAEDVMEFARGDHGRVKRKEDDRRKRIQPSETLFVVNFPEQTTKRDDFL